MLSERFDLSQTYSYRNTTANWIVYRLADVMLMKAEAMVQADRLG